MNQNNKNIGYALGVKYASYVANNPGPTQPAATQPPGDTTRSNTSGLDARIAHARQTRRASSPFERQSFRNLYAQQPANLVETFAGPWQRTRSNTSGMPGVSVLDARIARAQQTRRSSSPFERQSFRNLYAQ